MARTPPRVGLMDRMLSSVARRLVRASTTGAVYEGASQSRRTAGWRSPTSTPNAAVLCNLATLRDRSREATRNDGYAKGAIDKLVSNIIGTGIKPLSQADDPVFRKAAQALWLRWTDESDADGLLDWYGQQSQAARGWLEAGEIFIRLRPRLASDGLSVPLQMQVIEPELCPHTYNTSVLPNGNRVRAGIEFNPIGQRVAYWFYPSRPGDFNDFYYGQLDLRRVPAESVIHIFDPLRAGQIRGVPHLTQALVRLHELDKFDDATLLRQQLSNMFVGFVKRPANTGDAEMTHPLTGLPQEYDREGSPMLSMEPGIFQELGPGEDVSFSDPPEVRGYKDYTTQQLYHVSAATGVPYETLTGDMSHVNDRTVRVILHEFRRRLQAWQHQILAFQFCRPVYQAWMDRVFLSGALPIPVAYATNPEPWARVKWMPQGWPYLHPVQDVDAQQMAIRAGFTSRNSVVSEQGEDSAEIDAEQATDNARADGLKLHYDSDGRRPDGGAKPVGAGQGTT